MTREDEGTDGTPGTRASRGDTPYGAVAAATLLGHVLQLAGHPEGADLVVDRGDPGDPAPWSVCWVRVGRLVAVLAVGRPRDLAQGRRAIARRAHPDPVRLGDLAGALEDA